MVNVPGRSKGCGTCRQRRLACSLERPQCTRCIRSRRVCNGYERERIFVICSASTSEAGASNNPDQLVSSRHAHQGPIRSIHSMASLNPSLIQQALVHFAYRQQLLAHFLYAYIPADSWVPNALGSSDRGGLWWHLVPSLHDIPPALSYSIVALCAAYLGRLNADEALVQQGLTCYSRGLWALQKALANERAMYKDETLAACMALATYESIECPSGSNHGWGSHMDGCARLIQLRGPEAHMPGTFGHRLFISWRISGLMEAIIHIRPTYLSEGAWITVPWNGSSKTSIDQLIDITSALAGVLNGAFGLDTSNSTSLVPAGLNIIARCWTIDDSLRQFYNALEITNQGPLYWPTEPFQLFQRAEFPVPFGFSNLYNAHICALYWSTRILLWFVLSHTYRTLSNISTSHTSSLPSLEIKLNVKTLSSNICQAIPYFLQESMQGFGPALAAIPLVSVIEILKDVPGCEREVAWARAAMQKLPGRGMRLMNAEAVYE